MSKINAPKNLSGISENQILSGLSSKDTETIKLAIDIAKKVYGEKSLPLGECIIEHTLGIAKQAASLKMDTDSRCAAILSRVLTIDPKLTDEIQNAFGDSVIKIIRGLEKLRRINISVYNRIGVKSSKKVESKNSDLQKEALRKMLLVLTDDIRIIVLKLIGRIQTLHYIYKHPSDSARDIAYSSLHYFAPLANRLSIHELKWPIEDWSFRILEPQTYQKLAVSLSDKREERELFIEKVLTSINNILIEKKISAEVKGRAKHLYSINKKLQKKDIKFENLNDLNAVRILVKNVEHCYRVLDALHNNWEFVNAEFDDYIARPKANGYQSLHTVLMVDNKPVEIQIRTFKMHNLAESGLASHWRYKEGISRDLSFENRLGLLRELMDWQKDISISDERLQNLAEDVIYCLTPKGDVFDLQNGATPIDFAYRLHTEVGHRCRGAKVDGVLVTLNTNLKSGQCVEVITVKAGGPSRDWLRDELGYIKSKHAKSKVRQFFNAQNYLERLNEGKSIWQRLQNRLRPANKPSFSGEELSTKLGYKKVEDFYLALARSEIGMHHLQAMVRGLYSSDLDQVDALKSSNKKTKQKIGNILEEEFLDKVIILDLQGLKYQKARCCNPKPPNAIIGYITRNYVVSVHSINCLEFRYISNKLPEKVVAVTWKRSKLVENIEDNQDINHNNNQINITIYGKSYPKKSSSTILLTDVMNYLHQEKIQVVSMQYNIESNDLQPTITLTIKNISNLQKMINSLNNLATVNRIYM